MDRQRPRSDPSSGSGVTRRTVVVALGAASAGTIAGCLGDEDVPDPISLDDGQRCDQCGMVIENQPGPTGQAFFDADVPEGRDGPAWFCSGTCTYNYVFDQRDAGRNPSVVYETDYSSVDYSLSSEDDVTFVSAHLDAEDYAVAGDLTLVAGSDVRGAMGRDLIGFSDSDEAEAFADEHGGDLVSHGDVTRELIASLGGR